MIEEYISKQMISDDTIYINDNNLNVDKDIVKDYYLIEYYDLESEFDILDIYNLDSLQSDDNDNDNDNDNDKDKDNLLIIPTDEKQDSNDVNILNYYDNHEDIDQETEQEIDKVVEKLLDNNIDYKINDKDTDMIYYQYVYIHNLTNRVRFKKVKLKVKHNDSEDFIVFSDTDYVF